MPRFDVPTGNRPTLIPSALTLRAQSPARVFGFSVFGFSFDPTIQGLWPAKADENQLRCCKSDPAVPKAACGVMKLEDAPP